MWAPDAARKNGTYYLYFPAKDKEGVFRIGVATSKDPMGPFKAQPQPIKGSYSIDPAVFTDDDGSSYMYFGGIWGGQLQRNVDGKYDPDGSKTDLGRDDKRSEEHTSELQSLMRISYAVFCLKKKQNKYNKTSEI